MRSIAALVVALLVVAAGIVAWQLAPRRLTITSGQFPEELVYVRSSDDVVNGGAMFRPPKNASKSIAIIWMHGWGHSLQLAAVECLAATALECFAVTVATCSAHCRIALGTSQDRAKHLI